MAPQSLVERLSHQGVRQIAITWVNHAGESLVKVVPLRQYSTRSTMVLVSLPSQTPSAPMGGSNRCID